jgi:hypothetical protein
LKIKGDNMAKIKTQALNYEQAINAYFGGIRGLSKMALPFTCKCGKNTYTFEEIDEDEIKNQFQKPIMSVPEIFAHIRKDHHERIKKPKEEGKNEQTEIV